MSHVIIDRRKNDKGRSSINRQKFIGRVRNKLKDAIKKTIGQTNIQDLTKGKAKVKIPVGDLGEPKFHHDPNFGENDTVIPGNDRFIPGDKIQRRRAADGAGSQGSPDGEGEDEFTFHLTKEEFMDLFFENCALPDLIKKTLAPQQQEELKRAGYISEGPPSQLNVVRSMRRAKARRLALRAGKAKRLKQLEQERTILEREINNRKANSQDCSIEEQHLERILKEIETLKRKIKAVPFIDPLDLQFTNFTRVPQPVLKAAMICIMDVSGSMDERKKELAKTFFLLLYLFLERNYEHISIRYVRHHTVARECTEEEFYHATENGGTVVSSALELARDIIKENYPLNEWNIYVAQASDGDNYPDDNELSRDILTDGLLPIVQYFAYVQIQPDGDHDYLAQYNLENLWSVFEELSKGHKNLGISKVIDEQQVYPAFIKLFEKKKVPT